MTSFDFSDPDNQPWDGLINHLLDMPMQPPVTTSELASLRKEFTELTGVEVRIGGNTMMSSEERQIKIAMKEILGYIRESHCVAHGWDVRYGKGGVWGEWFPIRFEDVHATEEYKVALSALKATE